MPPVEFEAHYHDSHDSESLAAIQIAKSYVLSKERSRLVPSKCGPELTQTFWSEVLKTTFPDLRMAVISSAVL